MTEDQVQFSDKPDYSQRHRKLEWRDEWFHLDRSKNDRELEKVFEDAYNQKKKQIKQQREDADHQAAYRPAGAGTPWFSIGPRNINGRVKSIAVHPNNENVIYAGAASGGVWKTDDGGQSWRPLWNEQESLAIGSIAIAPSDPDNTLYVGTGEWTPTHSPSYPGAGVYVSTTGGRSWERRSSVNARRIARILVSQSDSRLVYVAGESGFERSDNGGVSWTTINSGQISDAIIDPNNADIIYINVVNDGIYKNTNRGSVGSSWNLLTNGPTGTNADWVRLAIGKNGTNRSNFILAKRSGTIYKSTDGGTNWDTLSGSHGGVGHHRWANLLAVAPDDQDIILAGGVDIERTSNGGGTWNRLTGMHADHHVAVFAPSNTNVVYSCDDAGVYKSNNKGATWKKVSHGLVITQLYDVGCWDPISNVVGGGSQDTGTLMTGGGLSWLRIEATHDGGYFVISPTDPRTIYAEFQNTVILKSTNGGRIWNRKTAGLTDGSPWTGVITMNQSDPNNLFVGTSRVFRTTDGCATDWVSSSQVLAGEVSSIAIAPSNTNRVYVGAGGRIYRTNDGGSTSPWSDKTTTDLPSTRPIKDIAVDYDDANRLIICYGGTWSTGTPRAPRHVFISTTGGDGWRDISGNLPNISVNAVALDPNNDNTIYIGTDVGVYRTINLGVDWQAFDNGIPNVIVSDLHVDPEDNMLYAATFGRGMYKLNIAPAVTEPRVDLYLRDSVLDIGERYPSPSGQPNPNDVSDQVYWWESPDIKVDVSPFYTPDTVFDGVEFDEDLAHNDPIRTQPNRFYLQVHNRGWEAATDVWVRAFFADAHAALPSLPNPLTPPNFDLTSTANWTPIGPAQRVSRLEPNRPVIISWEWVVPTTANTHSCLLAVASSIGDPITTTETNVNNLVKNEKRVCLNNLHVVNNLGPRPRQNLVKIKFHNPKPWDDLIDIVIDPINFTDGTIGMLLEKIELDSPNNAFQGVKVYPLHKEEDIGKWYIRPGTDENVDLDLDGIWRELDGTILYEFDPAKTSEIRGIKIQPYQTIQAVITCKGSRKVPYGLSQKFAVMQRQGGEIIGGNTYEIRLKRAAALHPVSRIHVVLEKMEMLNGIDAFKKEDRLCFTACVSFNDDACRRHWSRIPQKGYYERANWSNKKEIDIDVCIFDGYVAEEDNMCISLIPIREDWLNPEDKLRYYTVHLNGPSETWVGRYGPDNMPPNSYRENKLKLKLWYRIESIKF